MIEVILLERVDGIGPMGQVAKVKPGFARNFLLPKKKALRATKANLELFEKQRAELEAKNAALRAAAEAQAAKMDNLKLVIIRQASETGQLYGSVSTRDAADAAKEAGHNVDRHQVHIDTPIKALGLFPIKVRLHPEVTVKVTLNIARSADEAAIQAEKGVALLKAAAAQAAADAEQAAVEAIGVAEAPAAAPAEDEAPKKAKKARSKKAADTEEV